MKKVIIITIMQILSNYIYAEKKDSLIRTTKHEFEKGNRETALFKDLSIKKQKNILRIPNCKVFRDSKADDDFYEFNYIGDIQKKSPLKVISKTLYNGTEFLIVDNKNGCKLYTLLGKPHVSGSTIINFNESETTDRKKVIEVWKLMHNKFFKLKDIAFFSNLQFTDVRFIPNKCVVIKDIKGQYWKFFL